ncbi:MAG: phosphatase PAP2 family protein [Coriobacteriia bacterium]|nr:phosphatase PAP2 family protein [Coriobacteriia bacterium]
MDFLYALEGIRTQPVTDLMSVLTYLGTQYVFMIIAVIMLWCIDKRKAYFIFAVSLLGTVANQWLKLVFRIPRPWVLDPDFTIVESAREAAGGYSFPSGHTQFAVGAFGAIAVATKKRWVCVICIAIILIVPFSRMYLGVHTPLDVGVAFTCALALVALLWPCFKNEDRFHASFPFLLGGMLVAAIAFAVWVNTTPFPADIDAENLAEGLKNAWLLLGCTVGLIISYLFDRKYLHYEVKAPLPGQILKVVLGLVLMLGIIARLKPVLAALFGAAAWTSAIRYGLTVIFAGCIWPLTFTRFARIGA